MGTSMSSNNIGQQASECCRLDPNSVPCSSFTDYSISLPVNVSNKTKKQRRNIYVPSTLRRISTILGVKKRSANREATQTNAIRNFLSNVKTTDLKKLIESYDILEYIHQYKIQADLARPKVNSYNEDLLSLYLEHHATDVTLSYRDNLFPVHKPILCVRSPYFRELLSKINKFGSTVEVRFQQCRLNIYHFDEFLRHLYSGDTITADLAECLSREIDMRSSHLESDMRYLLETGIHADACLVFKQSNKINRRKPHWACSNASCNPASSQTEYSCHQALLASRSSFLRKIITTKQKDLNERPDKFDKLDSINRMKITFDESIIPRRFARVILHSIYLDNLSLEVLNTCACRCNEENLRVDESGKLGSPSRQYRDINNNCATVEASYSFLDLIELHGIASFLELNNLVQSCENLILECLSIENIPSASNLHHILAWLKSPKGSSWCRRQLISFFCKEFSTLTCFPLFYELEPDLLYEILQSDFLQVSEGEALKALIDWAEHRQQKIIDEREPNIVRNTLHVKKNYSLDSEIEDYERQVTDFGEDFDFTVDILLKKIRFYHILEEDFQKLKQVVNNDDLKSKFHLEDYQMGLLYDSYKSWFPTTNKTASFQKSERPRLFSIYVDEARNCLKSREKHDNLTSNSLESLLVSDQGVLPRGFALEQNSSSDDGCRWLTNPELICDAFEIMELRNDENDTYKFSQTHNDLVKALPPMTEETKNLLQKNISESMNISTSDDRVISLMTNRDKCHLYRLIELKCTRELGISDLYAIELHKSSCKLKTTTKIGRCFKRTRS